MCLDGRPVGAIYGFRYRGTFGFYQTGFDPGYARHGIGQVMIGLSIKSAIEEGADEYDLLHGTERYKSDWARCTRELARIEAYPPSLRGRVHDRLVALDGRARRAARSALGGMSPWKP
jgi:CelD/BcsL family acetyltransferase involved in cellulose biosynthesis